MILEKITANVYCGDILTELGGKAPSQQLGEATAPVDFASLISITSFVPVCPTLLRETSHTDKIIPTCRDQSTDWKCLRTTPKNRVGDYITS